MYELYEKLPTSLVSLLKAEMANSLGQIYHIPSRNLPGFLLALL